jgi:hypothetical protein
MKVIKSKVRAVIERVTEVEFDLFGEDKRLYVFENLDEDGKTCDYWFQNWECKDVTQFINYDDQRSIINAVQHHCKIV